MTMTAATASRFEGILWRPSASLRVTPAPTKKRSLVAAVLAAIYALSLLLAAAPAASSLGPSFSESGVAAQTHPAQAFVRAETPETPATVGPNSSYAYDGMSGCCVAPNPARFCSFSAGTEVLMADGTTKPIGEVDVGDWVLAEDPETGERGAREVTHLWIHQDTIIDLEIDGHDVATTGDHPFWNHTDSQWQRADALEPGDLVLTADGDLLAVDGLDWGSARTTDAYNLTVDDIHTYFIRVGSDKILVHNQCGELLSVESQIAGACDGVVGWG